MSLLSKLSRLSVPGTAPPQASSRAEHARANVLEELRARMQATLERAARRPAAPLPAVDTVELPFATQATSRGPLHVRIQRLSAAHRTGRASVSCARDACPQLLALLALDPVISECDPRRALYLDTETTGLAGGAGTVAFLVGLGWWEDATFVLEQFLVRALGEEAPMLERVAERVQGAAMLVTFNGKSFDMPLLRTRFVMARVTPPAEPPHLDLLHIARRVHRRRVKQGCRLVALEREVLGFQRIDDVESGDVAACYLHFLRTGNARALHGVIEHNAWDVVAMAALVGLYGEPLHAELAAIDLVGMAQTMRRAGAIERAAAMADAAFARDPSPDALRARADVAKARGDRARALTHFEALAASIDDASVRLELAKLYEHWVKEPARALEWVAQGTGEQPVQAQKRAERLLKKTRGRQGRLALSPTPRAK